METQVPSSRIRYSSETTKTDIETSPHGKYDVSNYVNQLRKITNEEKINILGIFWVPTVTYVFPSSSFGNEKVKRKF